MARGESKKGIKIFFTCVAILLIIAIVAGACWYFLVYKKKPIDNGLNTGDGDTTQGETKDPSGSDNKDPSGGDNKDPSGGGNTNGAYDATIGAGNLSDVSSADLSIHFIAPKVKASGDCTLIKVGNTEVLIDAGPTQGNAEAIKDYLATYCTDNVLEYVIVTHGDSDHISGMVGTSSGGKYNGILYNYQIGTIVQFDKTNQSLTTSSGGQSLYGKYVTAVEYAKEHGAAVYTGLQCWNETDGAHKSYALSETVTMNILYNYYYENKSSDENNYSVCMLLSQKINDTKTNHYLFTGDLEEKGEEYLVQYNELPEVELYKAGHHGSKTSSTNELLRVIKPKCVVVCCCAGYNQYHAAAENVFPTQAFVDRIGPYTDAVYVTIQWDETNNGYKPMNGNIILYCGKRAEDNVWSLKLYCSNNSVKLKDTEWFKANRTWNGAE